MARDIDAALRAKFIELYNGSAQEVGKLLGIPDRKAFELLRQCRTAIKARFLEEIEPLIADRKERLAFWTSVMRGEEMDVEDGSRVPPDLTLRLRASELLGKANLDFGERKVVEASITNTVPKTELEDRIKLIVENDDWML